jgi:hypothetical protein
MNDTRLSTLPDYVGQRLDQRLAALLAVGLRRAPADLHFKSPVVDQLALCYL